jgi:hypothetical protein
LPHGDLPRRPRRRPRVPAPCTAVVRLSLHPLPARLALSRSCWTRNGHRSFLTNHTPSGLLDEPYPVRPPSVHVVGTLSRAMNGVSRGFRGATEEPPTAGWT